MSNDKKIEIRFEPMLTYSHPGCDVAYGRLYINDLSIPSLRMCLGMYMMDLPLRVDRDKLIVVEKAPYLIQIPPYRYVTYMTAPHVLYLISSWGARLVFCGTDVKTCKRFPPSICETGDLEYVYSTLKNIFTGGET